MMQLEELSRKVSILQAFTEDEAEPAADGGAALNMAGMGDLGGDAYGDDY
jgi:hypothetical protein